jgi:Tfp pilus assembly protein PilN
MRAVNLLPGDARRRRGGSKPSKGLLAGVGAVAVLGSMGYWGYSIHSSVGAAETQLAVEQARGAELQGQLGVYQQIDARKAEQQARKGAVVALTAARVNWERVIRDVATVTPRQVWYTNVKVETPGLGSTGSSVPGAPVAAVHLDGFSHNQRQVAILMVRVGAVPGLGEPMLTSSTVQMKGNRRVIHFVIDIPIDQRAQDRPTLALDGSGATAADVSTATTTPQP